MANFVKFDQQILSALQSSGDTTAAQLAERIGLSTNACWRRIKKLEESGLIRRHVALLDEAKLGLNVTVFVGIKTNEHNDVWLEKFASGIKAIPEVIEFYRMSGDTDYLLKIVVKDIDDYDRVYKKIIAVTPLHDVSSSFAMERIKSSTELPIG